MSEIWVKTPYSSALSGRRSKDTAPELALRHALHRLGFRFRLHWRIPGSRFTADVVLPRYKTVVQIYGCYWHRHGCAIGGKLTAGPNAATWSDKFDRVKAREARASQALRELGYRTIVCWECAIRASAAGEAQRIADLLKREGQPSFK